MRFRSGLIIGLAVGYYFGTKAGRERYEQIEQWLDRLRGTTTFQEARTKLSDGIREGTTAARRLIEDAAAGITRSPDETAQLMGDPTFN